MKILVRILSKKRCFRRGFHSEHVKASQLPAISPRERFYHVLLSFSGKLIWNMAALVFGEILGMFLDTLTSDGKYAVEGCANLQLPIQMQFFEKEKTFSQFFL